MEQPLAETLRRLREHVGDEGLKAGDLAARTALPERVIAALLEGNTPPAGTIDERVCTRIRTLADAYVKRTTKKPSDLVIEIADRLRISRVWASKLLKGEKVPNVTLLHGLADFFDVDGGEAFFTAAPADALNRVLLKMLEEHESPSPMQDLLARYGVRATDLRSHGNLTLEQLEAVLEGVIKSVLPPGGGSTQ